VPLSVLSRPCAGTFIATPAQGRGSLAERTLQGATQEKRACSAQKAGLSITPDFV